MASLKVGDVADFNLAAARLRDRVRQIESPSIAAKMTTIPSVAKGMLLLRFGKIDSRP